MKDHNYTDDLDQQRRDLERELQEYQNMGILLDLEGKANTPGGIAGACLLADEGCFMRDYIPDATGQYVETLNFNYVPPQ